jgi:uncharacterized repeat protein (TIGR03803 family)
VRRAAIYFFAGLAFLASVNISSASTPTVLYNFCSISGCLDGSNPVGDLVQDENGNLYGITASGGASNLGTVFVLCAPGAVAPTICMGFGTWTETVLHSFAGGAGDGGLPLAGLVYDQSTGNLYGTTSAGGSGSCGGGCGTLFVENSNGGPLNVLHDFMGSGDGAVPTAELMADGSGNYYGTTSAGGSGSCSGGCGTVFVFNSVSSSYSVIHSFGGGTDGANPVAGLVFDSEGNLWGTAQNGGKKNFGAIFELATSGTLEYARDFKGKGDGSNPSAALAFDPAVGTLGTLYGTTRQGGNVKCTGGCGTVFEMQPQSGTPLYKNFYKFTGVGVKKTGAAPIARLAIETANPGHQGHLYGTASLGGINTGACPAEGCGTAFEICPPTITCSIFKGEKTLFAFDEVHGQNPAAGVLLDFSLFGLSLPDEPADDPLPPGGRGMCTTNCITTGTNGGSSGDGVVVALTD